MSQKHDGLGTSLTTEEPVLYQETLQASVLRQLCTLEI